jgi:ribosomal protein S18 acetylase RimI-like enzyme
VVRRRIQGGVTDALGEIEAVDAATVSVRTRRGLETIDRALVVAAKQVPPRPARRGAPHLAISTHDLEAIMVEGLAPLERGELGGWLLRAADGFTGRANSVLPLGDPGVSLSEAVDYCQSWYDQRGLPPLFSLFGPAGFAAGDDPLGADLLARGYQQVKSTAVLTAATGELPPELPHLGGAQVLLESTPSPVWWDAWAAARSHPDAERATARAVMTGSPDQLFARLEVGGAVIGLGRIVFAQGWAGVFALHVGPQHRRSGAALQLMGALGEASRSRGIRSLYLQVLKANAPALSLYERLGFATHHEYSYLTR